MFLEAVAAVAGDEVGGAVVAGGDECAGGAASACWAEVVAEPQRSTATLTAAKTGAHDTASVVLSQTVSSSTVASVRNSGPTRSSARA